VYFDDLVGTRDDVTDPEDDVSNSFFEEEVLAIAPFASRTGP
jgi:hypothetical protein